MGADASPGLRIGEVAESVGVTVRTIRYYEEIGLLDTGPERPSGQHRVYTEEQVRRLRDIVRIRDLLGLSLEQLTQLLTAEEARAQLREEWPAATDPGQQRRILRSALDHIQSQLNLVLERAVRLRDLERDLQAKRRDITDRLHRLDGGGIG